MGAIFISYRRDDTEGQSGRLFQELRLAFGAENVFMDVATIEPGVDFRRVIEENTAACGVLLSVIGRNWLTLADARGQRRLDDPNDFVRLETAAALRRDIPVVPVLVQGTPMPRAEELPEDLRELAYRNSVELTHARWDSDVQLLVAALKKLLARVPGAMPGPAAEAQTPGAAVPLPATPAAASARPVRWPWPALAGGMAALAFGGWQVLRPSAPLPVAGQRQQAPDVVRIPPTESAAASAAQADAARKAQEQLKVNQRRRDEAKKLEFARLEGVEQARLKSLQEAAEREAAQARLAADERDKERQRVAKAEAEARLLAAQSEAAQRRQSQIRAHNAGICVTGFVWREARPGDKVCVTPDVRGRTAIENQAAASTRSPTGGAYGPNTCKSGYVWRESWAGDVVCVVPSSRQQAANDNAQGRQRVVPLPG